MSIYDMYNYKEQYSMIFNETSTMWSDETKKRLELDSVLINRKFLETGVVPEQIIRALRKAFR